MKKYKCIICGHIYDDSKESVKFEDLPNDWKCPLCGAPKKLFEEITSDNNALDDDEKKFSNAVIIDKNNVSIERLVDKCIDCGICKKTCIEREGIDFGCNGKLCINCGQCLQFCPTGAIVSKSPILKINEAIKNNKILIAYTSPAVRVALGDAFGLEAGSFTQRKLVGVLRMLGFNYVLDTTFGADLTIMEEVAELLTRIKENKFLPMFTSCCPSWIKFAEINYPEILKNISTCKSPIGMQGAVVKSYFKEKKNLKEEDLFTVAITPCTAKKYEIKRDEITGTDEVLTISELISVIKDKNIKYDEIVESDYDNLLGEGSGSGVIFANTGGVMEAALRTANYMITGQNLKDEDINFKELRGMENVKEATINIGGINLNVCVIHQMSSAIPILEDVKNGTSKYQYIEIMNCYGGCIGGGGQPKNIAEREKEIKTARINSIYNKDSDSKIRFSHENSDVLRLYDEFLEKPFSPKAEKLLHTEYYDKSNYKKNS